MKTICIQQPYFLPYLGYFQMLNLSDVFVFLDDVNFIKKGWIHRNQILSQGKPLLFTVPMEEVSQNIKIKETLIHANYLQWKNKFVKTLEHNYRKAPFFEKIIPLIKEILENHRPGQPISWLAINSIIVMARLLGIKTDTVTSHVYYNAYLKGEERIVNICQQEKADRYVNAIGGKQLYCKERFAKEELELKFHKIDNYSYSQFGKNFIPNLSIIDVLMFCEPCQIKELLGAYQLT